MSTSLVKIKKYLKKKKKEAMLLSVSAFSSNNRCSTLDVLKKIGLLYSATGSGHRILIGFHLDRFTQSWMYC